MKTKTPPIKVKVGNVTVKIYRRTRRKGGAEYASFDVADYSSGKRVLVSFASEREARDRANEIAVKLANREGDVLELRSADKASYVRALEFLKPTGIPLEIAAGHFAESVKVLGSDRVLEASRYFIKAHPVDLPNKTVREVVAEMVKDAEGRGLSERYLEAMRHYGGKFSKAFVEVQLSSITAADVREFLGGLKLAPRSRNNFLSQIRTLFSFAQDRDYLPRDFRELERIDVVPDDAGQIDVYSPQEIERLLAAASDAIKPCIAIGAFAGLRSAEIERLEWADIKFESDCILVRAKGKDGARNKTGKRSAPLLPNLKKLLTPYRKASGPVWSHSHDSYYRMQKATAEGTMTDTLPAVEWKDNALRHSFISYRVQQTNNLNQVALEAGNSPQIILKHYREVELPDGRIITTKEAERWFSIEPKASDEKANIIPMPAASNA